MPKLLRLFFCATVLIAGLSPALSQTAPTKPQSPGEMAAVDKYATEKRSNCEREARAKKLSYMKRRTFVRNCVKR